MTIENLLKEISEESDLGYENGGIYYTYSYYHRCAHVNSSRSLLDLSGNRKLSYGEVEKIGFFIKCAIGEHHSDAQSNNAPQYISQLLDMLDEFDRVKITHYDQNDHQCFVSICIESICGNNGHKWILNWSID
jgi:hypothetical protein